MELIERQEGFPMLLKDLGNYAEKCIENEKLVEIYLTLSILRS